MIKRFLMFLSCSAVVLLLFSGCLTTEKSENVSKQKPAEPVSSSNPAPDEKESVTKTKEKLASGSLLISTVTSGEVTLPAGETFSLPKNGSVLVNKIEPGEYELTIRYGQEKTEHMTALIEENTVTEAAFTWVPDPEEQESGSGEKTAERKEAAEKNGNGLDTKNKETENPTRKIHLLEGTYTGRLKNGKRHGYGVMELRNGDRYEGEWHNDRKHGFGTYLWKDGDVYKGEWLNDMRHGTGTYSISNDDSYSGSWKEGNMHGIGIYTWANGDYYEGRWVDGKKEGKGLYKTVDGDSYDGEWADDRMHGEGTFIWADGDRYSGEWKNGLMHGKGTFYIAYRGRYEGTFKEGKAAGGWYYLQDGTKTWAYMNDFGEWELDEKAPEEKR